MKCPECDFEISEDDKYCPNCGTPIPTGGNPDNEPRLGKGLVAFIIIGTIFLVIFGVLYYNGHKHDPEYTQTAIEPDSNLIENTASKLQEEPKDTTAIDSVNQQEEEQAQKVFNSIRKTTRRHRQVKVESQSDETGNDAESNISGSTEGNTETSAPSHASEGGRPHIEPIEE